MCDANCVIFAAINLKQEEVMGKSIIEIGSYNVNGSLRPYIESLSPSEYIGVDVLDGPGVDMVCRAENLMDHFPADRFDIVLSTEMIEHVKDWRKVLSNIKRLCKPNGIIMITTRSLGFRYHGHPHDYWRYELEDMRFIFSDCEILNLEKDMITNGIYIKAKKLDVHEETDLSNYPLHSIVSNTRLKEITKIDFLKPHFIRVFIKGKVRKYIV